MMTQSLYIKYTLQQQRKYKKEPTDSAINIAEKTNPNLNRFKNGNEELSGINFNLNIL